MWVFGIVTTNFGRARGYFQVVERRDIATLDPIISKCIWPRTEIYNDDWASYRGMEHRINNVAVHWIVVHAWHFVDPVTCVHTLEVESCWNNLKLGQKIPRGMKKDLQLHLDKQMSHQWRREPYRQIMKKFFPCRMQWPTQHLDLFILRPRGTLGLELIRNVTFICCYIF